MSALVEIWEGELMKLRERVRLGKVLQQAKEEKAAEAEKEDEKRSGKRPERKEVAWAGTTMSEATVNLLMDRFVPW
ncbi:hypothetical protein SAY87_014374 [Trapa incisa]|uniref:Uncharacterized protein n=2 Tax=Trapa TaxID=22665 RepID=A0AAN7MRD1_TRANT|nr:hypothetical protein SAY87_014374 [Trapa incisa]KAK4803317.1 hypothetical protein SAY86_001520 [Trapa natans]